MEEQYHPVLEAHDLHKSFYQPAKVTLLKGVSLEVFPGESVSIMGASGEGKTTLLHVLGTLEPPSDGTLKVMGQAVSRRNRCRMRSTHLGFIFQSFHLLEDYSVLDNVLMPARVARKNVAKGSLVHQRACQLLEMVGLSDRLDFNTKLLSGGEKQRVSLARALINQPTILLADEPSGNLDHENSSRIHELLLSVAAEEQAAVIIVTHDEELDRLCQRRYQLRSGILYPQS